MRRRSTALAITLVAAIAAACTGGPGALGSAGPGASSATPAASVTPAAEPVAGDAWLVVGRAGEAGLEVIHSSDAESLVALPTALANDRWDLLVAATPDGDSTRVQVLDADAGWTGSEVEIDGRWRLPTIGRDPVVVGGSVDEKTVVLVELEPEGDGTTRFAVLRRPLGEPPRIIELAGEFEFDAISPDGWLLYVVEHLEARGDGHYQVRVVDVASGILQEGIVADKRTLQEEMAGWPIGQMRRADGLVFTLYDGADHPFIHALDTNEAAAVCIDLPHGHDREARSTLDWGIAQAGANLYAVNASLGHVVEIEGTTLEVLRSAEFEPLRSAAITLAKFGHGDGGPVNRRVVAAPDGTALFAAGSGGVAVVGTDELGVTGRFLEGKAVDAIGLSSDGGTLFALLRERGRIVELDARTGELRGEVPGEGYDRLLAVMPG